MLDSAVQFENASLEIVNTDVPSITVSKLAQPLNAELPIVPTPLPI